MDNEVKYSEEIEKVLNEKNKDCCMYGTPECEFLNAGSCSECSVAGLKPERREEAKKALSRLMQAAPQEVIEPLYNTRACRLCKMGKRRKADSYALFDLSKRDEEGDWTFAIGKRSVGVKAQDMILPLQVASCKRCRTLRRRFEYLPTLVGIAVAAIGLVLSAYVFYDKAFAIAPWMPAAIMAAFVLLAVAVSAVLKGVFAKAIKKHSTADAADIPEVRALMDRGFTEVRAKQRGVTPMVFSKQFREHGVGSLKTPRKRDGGEPVLMGIWPAEDPEHAAPEE